MRSRRTVTGTVTLGDGWLRVPRGWFHPQPTSKVGRSQALPEQR